MGTSIGSDPELARMTADDRDRRADKRDRFAADRDSAAHARDLEEERRHHDYTATVRTMDRGRVPDRRSTGSGRRAIDRAAASDRESAFERRREGAVDRVRASDDREAASADRDAAALDRGVSSIDGLTGAYRRGPGLVELEREWSRAQRTKRSFVVAFADVDGLKARNDSQGHAAGDGLLRDVVNTVRSRLRSYDLIVRFGGDEFVCALMDVDATDATNRFALVEGDLSLRGASITVGMAELGPGDSLSDLIARADEVLYEKRSSRSSTR